MLKLKVDITIKEKIGYRPINEIKDDNDITPP